MQKNNGVVSVIIVNWNGKHFLKTCLSSLFEQAYKKLDVILVDNASKDGSVEYVKKYFPKVRVLINKDNLGFAEGNNVGYREVKGEYVLFLNNDTRVTKTFITEALKVLESDKKVAGVQSKILLMDESTHLDAIGAFLTRTGFLFNFAIGKKDNPNYHKEFELYSAKGACMLFKKNLLDKTLVNKEVFDNRYFCYFEETDMCHRVWIAGYKILFAPNSIIYHKMGGTSTKLNNAFVQYHSFKNRLNSYIKNLTVSEFLIIFPFHLLLCEGFALYSLLKGNWQIFIAVQKAVWWNIVQISVTLKKREFIQKRIRKNNIDLTKLRPVKVKISYYYYLLKDLRKYDDF